MPGACEFPLLTGEGGAYGSEGHCAAVVFLAMPSVFPSGKARGPTYLGCLPWGIFSAGVGTPELRSLQVTEGHTLMFISLGRRECQTFPKC